SRRRHTRLQGDWSSDVCSSDLLWPLKNADGSFASNPYGLSTTLENKALDLLFQLRDVMRPDRRTLGLNEPITLIVIDEASIRTRSEERRVGKESRAQW